MERSSESTNRKSILLATIGMIVAFWLVQLIFGKNVVYYDEAAMRMIASGNLSGVASSNLLFINNIFCYGIAGLYSLTPEIEWYYLFMIVTMMFAMMVFVYKFENMISDSKHRMKYAAIGLILFLSVMYRLLWMISFTYTASIAGICLITVMYMSDDYSVGDGIVIGTLAILCAGIRYACLQMVAPFMIIVVAKDAYRLIHIRDNDLLNRSFIIKCIKKVLLYVCVLGIVLAVKNMALIGDTQVIKNERSVSGLRSSMQDFTGVPNYEEHVELYEQLGMDQYDAKVLEKWLWGFSDYMNVETLLPLSKRSYDEATNNGETGVANVKIKLQELAGYYSWFEKILAIAVIVIGIIDVIKRRDIWATIEIVLTAGIGIAELGYLAYKGRVLYRASCPVVLITVLMTILIVCRSHQRRGIEKLTADSKVKYIYYILVIVALATIAVEIADMNASYKKNSRDWALQDYMLSHNDAKYMYNCSPGMQDRLKLFRHYDNYVKINGWLCITPEWHTFICGDYENVWDALVNNEKLCIVTDENDDTAYFIEEYMKAKGMEPQLTCEELTIDGQIYKIWNYKR